MSARVNIHLKYFGSIWIDFGSFWLIFTLLDKFILTHLDSFDPFYKFGVDPFGLILAHLCPFVFIWAQLDWFWLILIHFTNLDPFGLILAHFDPFTKYGHQMETYHLKSTRKQTFDLIRKQSMNLWLIHHDVQIKCNQITKWMINNHF